MYLALDFFLLFKMSLEKEKRKMRKALGFFGAYVLSVLHYQCPQSFVGGISH
jgi:hypothetical protein